jgi:hypothetical protein
VIARSSRKYGQVAFLAGRASALRERSTVLDGVMYRVLGSFWHHSRPMMSRMLSRRESALCNRATRHHPSAGALG